MEAKSNDLLIRGNEVLQNKQLIGTFLSEVNALVETSWPKQLDANQIVIVRSGFPEGEIEGPLWLPGPRGQWAKFAKYVEGISENKTQLILWSRSTDVISDSPSTLSFVRSNPKWKFLLDPVALITEEMRRDVMEHVDRLVELMLPHEACAGVVHPGQILGSTALSAFEKAVAARGLVWWRVDGAAH